MRDDIGSYGDITTVINQDPKFKAIVKVVDLQKTIGGQLSVVQAEQITEVTVDVYKIPKDIKKQVIEGTLTQFIIHNAAYAP